METILEEIVWNFDDKDLTQEYYHLYLFDDTEYYTFSKDEFVDHLLNRRIAWIKDPNNPEIIKLQYPNSEILAYNISDLSDEFELLGAIATYMSYDITDELRPNVLQNIRQSFPRLGINRDHIYRYDLIRYPYAFGGVFLVEPGFYEVRLEDS